MNNYTIYRISTSRLYKIIGLFVDDRQYNNYILSNEVGNKVNMETDPEVIRRYSSHMNNMAIHTIIGYNQCLKDYEINVHDYYGYQLNIVPRMILFKQFILIYDYFVFLSNTWQFSKIVIL